MNDSELFELCKSVYKKTGWDTGENTKWYFPSGGVWMNSKILNHEQPLCPLYTSDYLLEKLPLNEGNHIIVQIWSGGRWAADWQPSKRKRYIYGISDTPLKALLKLTIALYEGEYLNGN